MYTLTLPCTRIGLATEGRVMTVRHGKLATHTGETAHPQLHAGSLATHHADRCMFTGAPRTRGICQAAPL